MTYTKIQFIADTMSAAQEAKKLLDMRYAAHLSQRPQVRIILGGDGFMLREMHRALGHSSALYGINFGTLGFLMNAPSLDHFLERLQRAEPVTTHPLKMVATTPDKKTHVRYGFNEISLLRSTAQTAKIEVSVDGHVQLPELICDGILVATPAGSTAYNLSAHGPILPIRSQTLALTPISAFRPRRWRGAILPNTAHIEFRTLEEDKRPMDAVADYRTVKNVTHVHVTEDASQSVTLLFDPEHTLDTRLLKEQFAG